MTVIYSDFGDTDTRVLKGIWEGLDAKVLRLTPWGRVSQYEIDQAISEEKGTLVFCGHGDRYGCWNPSYSARSRYSLSEANLACLNAEKVIGIWCHASDFAKAYDVHGFFSYMYISNVSEAAYEGIHGVPSKAITESEEKFCGILNGLLKEDRPLMEWKAAVMSRMDPSNPVEVFNYSQVCCR